LLAVLTLWAASFPIVGTDFFLFGGLAWWLLAVLWSARVSATADEGLVRAAALLLLIGTIASMPLFGISLMVIIIAGLIGAGAMAMTAAALFAIVVIKSRVRRVAWPIAPAIVAITLAVSLSGIPRLARLVAAEPELTTFVQGVASETGRGERSQYFDDPVVVGSMPVYEVFERHGLVHLVTGHVGIMADDGAGIAYSPDRSLRSPLYDHLFGPWYRWFPY
jgi:hypothetical protein